MIQKTEETFWVKLYIAGPEPVAEQICREYCFNVGLCVTIEKTKFIYTGGEETGVIVGLINYPRFPEDPGNINKVAEGLAMKMLREMHQHSVLIQTPQTTKWISLRESE